MDRNKRKNCCTDGHCAVRAHVPSCRPSDQSYACSLVRHFFIFINLFWWFHQKYSNRKQKYRFKCSIKINCQPEKWAVAKVWADRRMLRVKKFSDSPSTLRWSIFNLSGIAVRFNLFVFNYVFKCTSFVLVNSIICFCELFDSALINFISNRIVRCMQRVGQQLIGSRLKFQRLQQPVNSKIIATNHFTLWRLHFQA